MSDARERNVRLFAILVGDWPSVIRITNFVGVEQYRDGLLNQKPDNEEDAEYNIYRVPVKNHGELMHVLHCASLHKLTAHIGIEIKDAGVVGWCETNDAWGSGGAYAMFKSTIGLPSDSVLQRDLELLRKQCGDIEAAAATRIDDLETEVEWLRLALKMVRTKAREAWKITTREFAKACGVAPSQLCHWTAEEITEEPDFVD